MSHLQISIRLLYIEKGRNSWRCRVFFLWDSHFDYTWSKPVLTDSDFSDVRPHFCCPQLPFHDVHPYRWRGEVVKELTFHRRWRRTTSCIYCCWSSWRCCWWSGVLSSTRLPVCLRAHLWNRWTDLHEILSADPPWPWLGPPLAALRHVKYFRFYGRRDVWP